MEDTESRVLIFGAWGAIRRMPCAYILSSMKTPQQIEKDILGLPPAERARLAVTAWDSLEADPGFAADRAFDPDGLVVASERDRQIEAGSSKPLTYKEFVRRTGGASE